MKQVCLFIHPPYERSFCTPHCTLAQRILTPISRWPPQPTTWTSVLSLLTPTPLSSTPTPPKNPRFTNNPLHSVSILNSLPPQDKTHSNTSVGNVPSTFHPAYPPSSVYIQFDLVRPRTIPTGKRACICGMSAVATMPTRSTTSWRSERIVGAMVKVIRPMRMSGWMTKAMKIL